MRLAGVSRLRAVDLGKHDDISGALARAQRQPAKDPSAVMAHNVRVACDSWRGARWGLSHDQIARLRAGETIMMEDRIGRFAIRYVDNRVT
jgi:hypothetical protein